MLILPEGGVLMPLTRSQRDAVESAHEPLFIQAGAGTGKTFTLTKRLAYGLSEESGRLISDVCRLLTITFTNKAAGELIGRVRAELRACGLTQEALQIDASWISTIHSMCKRMLLSHAFDVGVDPGANLLSEDETEGLSALALDELLQERAQDECLIRLLDAFGVKGGIDLISNLSGLFALSPEGMAGFDFGPAPAPATTQRVQRVLSQYEQAAAELEALGIPQDKQTYVDNYETIHITIRLLTEWLGNTAQKVSWQDISTLLDSCKAVKGGSFKQEYKAIFNDCKVALLEAQVEASCAVAYENLLAAAELACEHVKKHGELKRQRGALDTNDLLIAAYRMLLQDPLTAEEYRKQFDSVMVDEFQDTDSLQVGIIKQLCNDDLATLTTVGDAQQSIYGFRGADLEVYRSMRQTMCAHGSRELELTINYRSHADILRFVEDIFSKQEFFGAEFLKVDSGREDEPSPQWLAGNEARVKVLLSAGRKAETGRGKTSLSALREADAVALADEFQRLKSQGAQYGDMAILLQSTKSARAGAYIRELRKRGVPCVVSGGSDFFLASEVKVLVMLLRVLANQDDDEALFALLGSSMFDISDDDFVRLSVINKQKLKLAPEQARPKPSLFDALRYSVQKEECEAGAGLSHAFEVLDHALAYALHAPLSQVVRRAVALSGWSLGLREQGAEGGAAYANIERFCDMLDEFEDLNGRSFYRASEYFRSMLDLAEQGVGARFKPGTLVSSGRDAVQIMTIHSSKGLEFPIVAVAEFEKSSQGGNGEVYSLTEGQGRYLALGFAKSSAVGKQLLGSEGLPSSFTDARSPGSYRAYAHQLNEQRQYEEQQRLLYVALTRARDMLILVTHDKSYASTGEFEAGLTGECLNAAFSNEVPKTNAMVKTSAGALVSFSITNVAYEQDAESGQSKQDSVPSHEHLYPSFEDPKQISSVVQASTGSYSYSSISKRGSEAYHPAAQTITLRNRSEDTETVSPVGSAFHLVAQWLIASNSGEPTALEHRISASIRRYSLNDVQARRLLDALGAWIGSARFAQAIACERKYAEYPFCVEIDGSSLEGFIDLLCLDEAQNALVIDYKTGTSAQGELAELESRYRLQAQCYAYALLSSDVCEHVELVFVRPEANMEEVVFAFDKGDVPALIQAILS